MTESLGAFVAHAAVRLEGSTDGPLAGLEFAAKDLFDVAGVVTGCGSPDWIRTHGPAKSTAPAIRRLVAAGATLVGKTLTDELAYSINGENHHFGTPVNVNAPGRIPGGSSSGSAAAVAGGLVDFALGTDTGGSIRVPASFCGVYGLRPTHGRIPLEGVQPLAPSFDTIGWFAREAELMARVGRVLLDWRLPAMPRRVLIPADLWAMAEKATRHALEEPLRRVVDLVGGMEELTLADGGIEIWYRAFRTLQGREVWRTHGAWLTEVKPQIGPGIAERLAWTATLTEEEEAAAAAIRDRAVASLESLLVDAAVIVAPVVPGIAPRRGLPPDELEDFRHRVIGMTCVASLAGLPQIALPLGTRDGCPVALSLVAWRDGDEMLLELAQRLVS